jgi:hypothetical protein
MTAHLCTTPTPGCFRCELNADEVRDITSTRPPLPRNPDGSLTRSAPSHRPERLNWEVTWKQRLSDPWQTAEFADEEDAQHFVEEVAPFVLPDSYGREWAQVG